MSPDWRRPVFTVDIQGSKVESLGAAIREVNFEEQEDQPDSLTLSVINVNQKFVDDPKSVEGTVVSVSMGYEDDLVSFGEFKLQRPEIVFPESGHVEFAFKGMRTYDAALSSNQERRQFKAKTDSEIASILAKENGLKTSVTDPKTKKPISTITATSKRNKTLTVTGKTWMEFLMNRAKKYGFSVWVDQGALWFGPIGNSSAANQKGLTFNLRWNPDGTGNLKRFTLKDEASGKAAKTAATGTNPKTGKPFSATGDPVPKPDGASSAKTDKNKEKYDDAYEVRSGKKVTRKTEKTKEQSAKNKNVTKHSPTQTVEGNPTVYVVGDAEIEDDESAKRISGAQAQSSAWSIEGTVELAIGTPHLRKHQSINIDGVGKFSSRYLLTGTTHRINETGYEVSGLVKTYKIGTSKPAGKPKARNSSKDKPAPGSGESSKNDKGSDVVKPKSAGKYDVRTGAYTPPSK